MLYCAKSTVVHLPVSAFERHKKHILHVTFVCMTVLQINYGCIYHLWQKMHPANTVG